MQQIDETRLEADLEYRFQYLCGFIGFGETDIAAIHASAEVLGPLVPSLVDAVYDKLFLYDATKRHFVERQSGYDGNAPTSLDDLTLDHEMIAFRKQHLAKYLTRLVTKSYDTDMVKYLDLVGKIHTPKSGSSLLHVPLVQMNALMGFVSTALISAIASLDLPAEAKNATLATFNKLLWLQNDLIVRHYT